jgi:lysophospholipase L1-like esterase
VSHPESRHLGASALLAAASLLLSLAAAELALRATAPAPEHFGVWPAHLDLTLHPAPGALPGVDGPSRFTTNADGLRAEARRPEHAYRILAIGGSTTESLYLDDTETWPHLLQQRLGAARGRADVWVGNAGKSGLNSRHHVVQALQLLPQLPQMDVVLVLAGVNDLHHRLSLDTDFRPIDQEPRSAFADLYARAFDVRPAPQPLWQPVQLARRVAQLLARWGGEAEPVELIQDDAGRVYEKWRRHRSEATRWRSALPNLDSALREYAANLHTIADIAQRHGARVVFVTQPVMWDAQLGAAERALLWLGGVGEFQREPGHEYYRAEALAEGMARYNTALLEVCAVRGLDCVDLAGALPRDTRSFYDDCHFNEAGSRRVATLLAEHLAGGAPRLAQAGAAAP